MTTIIVWIAYFTLSLLTSIPVVLIIYPMGWVGLRKLRAKIVFKFTFYWAKILIWTTGTKVEVIGSEKIPKDLAVLFVVNHQGAFDIPLMIAYINKPKAFIAKASLKFFPILGFWAHFMGCVFIDRENVKSTVESFYKGIDRLKEGISIVIFPEGTRSHGDQMKKFKSGSFKLAFKSQVPIVPVTIINSFKIGKSKPLLKSEHVRLIISDPIETANITKQREHSIPEEVEQIVYQNLQRFNPN